uniref:Transthyretin-like family protein n=1 Tax=Romanomermis culicivorax TaxID=13658 RepID=A0A915IGX5_ROMCU
MNNISMKVQILALISLIFVGGTSAGLQKYAVKGRLMCGAVPATGDSYDTGRPDDNLDEKTTDGQGNFYLAGQTSELGDIDPMLKIYHHCLDGVFSIRKRRWRFELPKKNIGHGSNSQPKILELGTINLEVKPLAEDRNF